MANVTEMIPKGIYQLGKTGIHVDPSELSHHTKKWFAGLEDKKKREQVAVVATLGLTLCLGVLAYIAIKD